MKLDDNKDKGRAGLLLGMQYFGLQGYTISLPINDTQWYDFVIEKNGKFETVQCKFTDTENSEVDFRSTGGTDGGVIGNILDYPLDYLFCANEKNSYVIPLSDIRKSGNKRSIVLKTEPNKNHQGFETYKYLVEIR